jgi:hypothetical protein
MYTPDGLPDTISWLIPASNKLVLLAVHGRCLVPSGGCAPGARCSCEVERRLLPKAEVTCWWRGEVKDWLLPAVEVKVVAFCV